MIATEEFDCGCYLLESSAGATKLGYCKLHESAASLLAACKEALEWIDANNGHVCTREPHENCGVPTKVILQNAIKLAGGANGS